MRRTDKILSFFAPDVRSRYAVEQTRNADGTITYKLDVKPGHETVHEKFWVGGFQSTLAYFQQTGAYVRHFVKRPGKEFEITLTP